MLRTYPSNTVASVACLKYQLNIQKTLKLENSVLTTLLNLDIDLVWLLPEQDLELDPLAQ